MNMVDRASILGNPVRQAVRCRGIRAWTPPDDFGVQRFEVGLDLGSLETARQGKTYWCWAACIQAAFATRGYRVRQNRVVQKVFGKPADSGAIGPEVAEAVNGLWVGEWGARFRAEARVLWDFWSSIEREDALMIVARELGFGNSLILGLRGHAVLLTGMTYEAWPDGETVIDTLTIRDPWPGVPNRQIIDGLNILDSEFLCAVRTSAAIF